MANPLQTLAARMRNIFNIASLEKRDGREVTIQTDFCRTLEGKEFFPYGFFAKGMEGRTAVLTQGGNAGSYIILPVSCVDGAPELEEGDACLWTKDGGVVIARKAGEVELNGTGLGGLVKAGELKDQLEKNNKILKALLQTLSTPVTEPGNGSPSAFQAALKMAVDLAFTVPGSPGPPAPQVADLSNIENDKVQHGNG